MRNADGGGLTAERRAACEGIRLEAGQRFARGDRTSVIAKDLRVSERSVEQWHRDWREGGIEGLKSKGPGKLPKLGWDRNTSETCHTPAASTSQGVPVVLAEKTTLSGWGVPELG
ncbi:helix-turn-helix domain-containing protein [Streptomyces sp. NBC_01728]|nr:helix-turn-helix domain-containing protein [Streptomyces sp. NBC_01719]MCX4460692.1 helix-turn-helix domain-containing protein [Streptomyces sp. NBC_01719]MCX4499978.1 helix-turn-helix domain-containing protein [Streptomyces sp. NBC_01728]